MNGAPRSRFLEVEALSRLGNLRLRVDKVIEGPYAGRHESVERGGAVEFVDFRQYTPGEDLRRLDWKALARLRKPYVRTFADETNLVCTMLLDASASMLFAGHLRPGLSKLAYARYLVAAVAFLLSRDRDQVARTASATTCRRAAPRCIFPGFARLLKRSRPSGKRGWPTRCARFSRWCGGGGCWLC